MDFFDWMLTGWFFLIFAISVIILLEKRKENKNGNV